MQHIQSGSACLKAALSGASLSIGSSIWCWLDENYRVVATLGVFVGAFVGVAGLYQQHRINRRRLAIDVAEHEARMDALRRNGAAGNRPERDES